MIKMKVEAKINSEYEDTGNMLQDMETLLFEAQQCFSKFGLSLAERNSSQEIMNAFKAYIDCVDTCEKRFKALNTSATKLGRSLDPILKELDGK